jgi:hypothetical protein
MLYSLLLLASNPSAYPGCNDRVYTPAEEPGGPDAAAARRAMKLPVGGEQPSRLLPSAGDMDRPAALLLPGWPWAWC